MDTIAERLKAREDALVVAKDEELRHHWDLAMQIRADVRINLGWYSLWSAVSDMYHRALWTGTYAIGQIWGSTITQVYAPNSKRLLNIEDHEHHVVITEATPGIRLANFAANFGVVRFYRYPSPWPEVRVGGIKITGAKSAGEALSSLSDAERDKMQWR